LKKTKQHFIPKLYKGKLSNKIVCTECGEVTDKVEEYYDLTLMVKDIKNLEESIKKYTEVETLTGENK
jgi:ubiquitin C-terminal hydrolase